MIHRLLFTAAALFTLSACTHFPATKTQSSGATAPASVSADVTSLKADVLGGAGTTIGSLDLKQSPHGVLMRVELGAGSLTPGWHGLHLHQVGDCSDTGVYKLSGGHVGKVAGGHGLLNPAGPEGGDTPNIYWRLIRHPTRF